MFYTSIVTIIYVITLALGVLGNCWVISSVIRSRRPRSGTTLTPSDRLRTYIGLLGVVDLLVILSLVIRSAYVLLPNATITTCSCRVIFIIDHLVKLASLTCLMCISVERYITIRKPFSSKVRKRFIQLTPFLAFLQLAFILSGIAGLSSYVVSDSDHMNCVRETSAPAIILAAGIEAKKSVEWRSFGANVACWIIAVGFLLQLSTVSFSYSQIVRHVRRKFWQRKARVVANSRSAARKPLIVTEPRYMKDMTAAIVRIAFFHVICWLPYCVLQVLPEAIHLASPNDEANSLSEFVTTALRFITSKNYEDGLAWLAFASDWLTYVNSAGDWIFYAAMNRDLRSIIRATTERRKRSTMSQHSPSTLHRSLRKQMTQSLRFFYSINSYRSTGNSLDESCSTIHNQPLASNGKQLYCDSPSLSPPANNIHNNIRNNNNNSHHKSSTASANGSITNGNGSGAEGLFGMRNGRAHTYCSPRPVHFSNHVVMNGGQKHVITTGTPVITSHGTCNKQMFFPSTGLSTGYFNGSSNGISQLATRKISNISNNSGNAAVHNQNVLASAEKAILVEEKQLNNNENDNNNSNNNNNCRLQRPILSRILLMSTIKMPVALTGKFYKSQSAASHSNNSCQQKQQQQQLLSNGKVDVKKSIPDNMA